MHSSQGLTPQDSLRTYDLALKAQARMKLTKTHINVDALYIDDYSQLPCEINHAAALRTPYARENAYGLNKSFYHTPRERYGRIAVLAYGGDRLQFPQVPESSGDYWMFPKQCSEVMKWLIVYVMLPRPKSLGQLRSINLNKKIRDIIEKGPPK